MPLTPGTRLGSHEIVAAIGKGGMGEVFRARDTKLDRDVAVKVLPAELAQDRDRLARFEREAKLLASLNHPNIAHVYGFEGAALPDGSTAHFLAMELVEGEDLSQRLKRGAIPVDESIAIAKQIAEALEEAHEHGIIHRDLKPANVKVTPDGKVKVLDFGLAKALEGDPAKSGASSQMSHSPTMSRHMTEAGMIMGTAAYMSPEQARGKPVDKRADIWAFGVVLFEMLTGERLFTGETVSDVMASVLKGDLNLGVLPASTPPRLRLLIERCLERDPKARLRDIGEGRVELGKIGSGAAEPSGAIPAAQGVGAAKGRNRWLELSVAAAIASLVTFGLVRSLAPVPTGATVTRLSVALPDGDALGAVNMRPLAISRDGTHLAYVGQRDGTNRIYVRSLNEPVPTALDGTEGGESPFFSPDARWLGFFAGAKLRKIAVSGGAAQTLADAPYSRGGAWGDDGFIYYAPTNVGGLWRISEAGGTPEEFTKKEMATGEISHRWPHVIPGTGTVLFGLWTGPGDDEQHVGVKRLGEAAHRLLVRNAGAPSYVAPLGALLYTQMGDLFAVPWTPSDNDLGRAVPVTMPEHPYDSGQNESAGNYMTAADGTLVYVPGGRARRATRVVWVDRSGRVTQPPFPPRNYDTATISPDGTRAIVQSREGVVRLYLYDFARETLTPIGEDDASSQSAVWTADGSRIVYRATRKGLRNIYWRPADGSGAEEMLTSKADVVQSPSSTSRDGHIFFNETGASDRGGNGLWVMRLEGDRTPRRLLGESAGEESPAVSPDGRWFAYEAKVSARTEIFVSPFPGPGPRHQISTAGGAEPAWSGDGRELFFQAGAWLMSVSVNPGATFSSGPPRPLYEGRFMGSYNSRTSWSVTPDGKRFLRIQRVETDRPFTRLELTLNWAEEIKAKLGQR